MTNNSIRLSRKWQITAWTAFAVLFVAFPIFSLPESTWNILCSAAEVVGYICDAQSDGTHEPPEVQILILALFAMMLSVLIVMTFVGMIVLNLIVADMPFFVAIKNAFWVFQFPQSVLTLMMFVFAVGFVYLSRVILDGVHDIHIVVLSGAAITAFITILFTLVSMRFSEKYKQEIAVQLDKFSDINSTLADMNNTLNNMNSALEKNADMLEKINKKLDKPSNNL